MKILLGNGYFVEIDKLNHTLKKKCKGTGKDGKEKEHEKTHGYFSNLESAIERYLKLNQIDLMAESSLEMRRYVEVIDEINRSAVKAFKAIAEEVDGNKEISEELSREVEKFKEV